MLSAVVVMLGFQVVSLNEQVNMLSANVGNLLDEARQPSQAEPEPSPDAQSAQPQASPAAGEPAPSQEDANG